MLYCLNFRGHVVIRKYYFRLKYLLWDVAVTPQSNDIGGTTISLSWRRRIFRLICPQMFLGSLLPWRARVSNRDRIVQKKCAKMSEFIKIYGLWKHLGDVHGEYGLYVIGWCWLTARFTRFTSVYKLCVNLFVTRSYRGNACTYKSYTAQYVRGVRPRRRPPGVVDAHHVRTVSPCRCCQNRPKAVWVRSSAAPLNSHPRNKGP